MVEAQYPKRRNPPLDRRAAFDPTVDRLTSVDGTTTVYPAFDRGAPLNPALDGIATIDGQSSFERIHALDELAEPRLFRASAWQHAGGSVPEKPPVRRGGAEEIRVESQKFKRSRR
jgi:hypothetical protein